ncbi:Probable proline--tRNA ligase, mitochondrial [Eumeta japonica]|uniref:Probable proline--tRNA ligase, mitochondrial n=1 Tax=Eumeta variegata TaxID=151549 RepID=A0A4C1T997_EUMVA|nr:Probable proline--tRNA ligase, mitochondrial [Eumeta japonica]
MRVRTSGSSSFHRDRYGYISELLLHGQPTVDTHTHTPEHSGIDRTLLSIDRYNRQGRLTARDQSTAPVEHQNGRLSVALSRSVRTVSLARRSPGTSHRLTPVPAPVAGCRRPATTTTLMREKCKVHGHTSSIKIIPVVPPSRSLACGPVPWTTRLVCYCVSIFLRVAFQSVGLRACMSVYGAAQCTSRGNSYVTFALVPVIYPGYRTVCTPSPRTVGHTFILGTRYSEALGANSTPQSGVPAPLLMSCYGVGLSRLAAACVEVKNERVLRWPIVVAPYVLCAIGPKAISRYPIPAHEAGSALMPPVTCLELRSWAAMTAYFMEGSKEWLSGGGDATEQICRKLVQEIPTLAQDVMIDDRHHLTIGKRMMHADRSGYPFIIVCGKSALETPARYELHVTNRADLPPQVLTFAEMVDTIKKLLQIQEVIPIHEVSDEVKLLRRHDKESAVLGRERRARADASEAETEKRIQSCPMIGVEDKTAIRARATQTGIEIENNEDRDSDRKRDRTM